MENPDEQLVIVYTTEDQVQESLIIGALEKAEIKYTVRSFEDSAYDGLFTRHYGHSQILVFEHDAEQAKLIVSDLIPPSDGNSGSSPVDE